ncbi:MAG TPA: hypothetical protein DEG43_13675 [Acidimicrobiaceae bacterium]|mgnify:CR=1 FL=1|jgi:hypothetical protein|nr:hypothetical protein [Acidimicrobiaceae bacterium]
MSIFRPSKADDPVGKPLTKPPSSELPTSTAAEHGGDSRGRAPVAGLVIGGAIMLFAFRGILQQQDRTAPLNLGFWVIGADLVHDLILAPFAFGAAALVIRFVPKPAQVPVLWAGATSLILILYSFAFLRGYGRKASVPSLLNRNYSLGLLSALGAIWAIAAVWCAVRLRAVAERNNLAPEPPPATET